MLQLEKDTFEAEVFASQGLVLVDYWSDKCEVCKALMPHVIELSEEYGDRIKFAKLNTLKAMKVARKQKVMGLPTIILYKDGEKVAELIKEDATRENIKEMITQAL